MRRHDMAKKFTNTNTKTMTMTKTKTLKEQSLGLVTIETFDEQ